MAQIIKNKLPILQYITQGKTPQEHIHNLFLFYKSGVFLHNFELKIFLMIYILIML